jgi:methylthioribulose-1-phosphate dehydratase
VQKERIQPSHIFVLSFPAPSPDGDRVFLRRPSLKLKESACTPLFWNAFDLRGAGSCIHTHSQNAVIVTLLTPGNTFRISHQVRAGKHPLYPPWRWRRRVETHDPRLFIP